MSPLEALAREWWVKYKYPLARDKALAVMILPVQDSVTVASLTVLLERVQGEERERCAAIADEHEGNLERIAAPRKGSDYAGTMGMAFVAKSIAAAIRDSSQETRRVKETP